jgi:hypothetical protein
MMVASPAYCIDRRWSTTRRSCIDQPGLQSPIFSTMPAKYLRWPVSDQPIFEMTPQRRIATLSPLVIDAPFLWSFGKLRVPLEIWQALLRYNVWVEPVLIARKRRDQCLQPTRSRR